MKKIIAKLKGRVSFSKGTKSHELGKGSVISKKSSIKSSLLNGDIIIDDNCDIEDSELNGNIKIGKQAKISQSLVAGKVSIGHKSKIIDGVMLSGEIEIGNYSSINGPNTDLRCRLNPIRIGNFCSIARNVTFQEYNHDFTRLTSYFVQHNLLGKSVKDDVVSKGAINLGHDVWIGTHCVILSGVTIGTGAVIAANTVVSKDIPPYAIVGGNPARVLKYRFNKATRDVLLASNWWDKEEKEIIDYYNKFGSVINTDKEL